MTSTTGSFSGATARPGSGWISFAMVMLGVVGVFNVVDGIVALSRSSFYVDNARYVFSDLHTWGWIVLGIGVVQVIVALTISTGSEMARWTGVAVASLGAIGQLLFLPAYPLWSIAAFSMDVLVVYALVVYGGSHLKAPAGAR